MCKIQHPHFYDITFQEIKFICFSFLLLLATSLAAFVYASQDPTSTQSVDTELFIERWKVQNIIGHKIAPQQQIDSSLEQILYPYNVNLFVENNVTTINQIMQHPPIKVFEEHVAPYLLNGRMVDLSNQQSSNSAPMKYGESSRLYNVSYPVQQLYSGVENMISTEEESYRIKMTSWQNDITFYNPDALNTFEFKAITPAVLLSQQNIIETTLNRVYFPNVVEQVIAYRWSAMDDINLNLDDVERVIERLSHNVNNDNWDSGLINTALDFFYDEMLLMEHAQLGIHSILPIDSIKLIMSDGFVQNNPEQLYQASPTISPAATLLIDPSPPENKFIEAESILIASQALTLTLNTSLINTQNDSNLDQYSGSFSSDNVSWAPNVKNNLGAEYFIPLELGELSIQVDYSYFDQADSTHDQTLNGLDSFDSLSSRMTYQSQSNVWHISAWMKNFTDKNDFKQKNYTFFGVQPVDYTDPQTYGVQFKYKFD